MSDFQINFMDQPTEEVDTSAVQLAQLLQQTVEFQELIRLARLINLDPDVNRLLTQIRQKESVYGGEDDSVSIGVLEAELEALPAYQAYLKAEKLTRDLFQSVDQVISAAAGMDFAINARRSSCSCGG